MKGTPKILLYIAVLTIPVLSALLGTFLGLGLLAVYRRIAEPFEHYDISPLEGAKSILYIESPYLGPPDGGVLYVATENGTVFFNTLFQDEWQITTSTPEITQKTPSCHNKYLEYLPKKAITDSAGIIHSGDYSSTWQCYVLYSDGSMQVWISYFSLFDIMRVYASGGLGLVAGMVLGIFTSIFIWRKYKIMAGQSPINASQHSMQLIGGIRRVFNHFSGLGISHCNEYCPRPPTTIR